MVKEIVSAMFILIVIFLLVNNAKGTEAVVAATGNAVSNNVMTLQGHGQFSQGAPQLSFNLN